MKLSKTIKQYPNSTILSLGYLRARSSARSNCCADLRRVTLYHESNFILCVDHRVDRPVGSSSYTSRRTTGVARLYCTLIGGRVLLFINLLSEQLREHFYSLQNNILFAPYIRFVPGTILSGRFDSYYLRCRTGFAFSIL